MLLRLLLDEQDTAVTLETAEAMLEVNSSDGVRVVARAFAEEADQVKNHLWDAVNNTHLQDSDSYRAFHRCVETLVANGDPLVRTGLRQLLGLLEASHY